LPLLRQALEIDRTAYTHITVAPEDAKNKKSVATTRNIIAEDMFHLAQNLKELAQFPEAAEICSEALLIAGTKNLHGSPRNFNKKFFRFRTTCSNLEIFC
jgi:hypothetical protein